jgi:hypothetical protein
MYITYYPNGEPIGELPEPFYILSIDPGINNVGFRIERRHTKWHKGRRYTKRIETFFMAVLDFSAEHFYQSLLHAKNCFNACRFWFYRLSIIVIEEQLSKQNPKSTRMGQHFLSMLMERLSDSPLRPVIYEVHTQATKRWLGLDRGLGTTVVKNKIWEMGLAILEEGKDKKGITTLSEYKKSSQYHQTDAIVQIEYLLEEEGHPGLKKIATLKKRHGG